MKLSEAILLGSIGSIQGVGPESIDPRNRHKGLCAMGAALYAVNCTGNMWDGMESISHIWPWTNRPEQPPIVLFGRPESTYTVQGIIWRLNDLCNWTRPQIAAWVASIEPEEGGTLCDNINLAVQSLDTVSPR